MEHQTVISPENSGVEESVNLRHYWHVILERRWLVVTAFISVFVLSLIYLYKAPRIYQATARLQIDRENANVLNLREVLSFDGREQDYLQTQYKNLQSRSLIESVISGLKLDKDERYVKALDIYRAVAGDVTIAPIRLSRLVDIKAEHPKPHMAAVIVNTIVTNFLQNNLDQKIDKLKSALEYLKQETDRLEKEVAVRDRELQNYRREKKLISLAESENIALQSLKEAQTYLVREQSEANVAQTMADEARRWTNSASIDTIPEVVANPLIQKLRNDLALDRAEMAELLTKYGNRWPAVIQKRQKIEKLEESLKKEAQNIFDSIIARAEMAKTRVANLLTSVDKLVNEQYTLGDLRVEYGVLSRKAESTKLLYDLVLQERKKTDISANDKTQNMRVVDWAREPLRPIKPRFLLTLVLGVFGGLVVAIGLAFFVNYLDDSIKIQDDVETYLRLPFLGYVPNIKTNSLVERDLQAHLHPRSTAAEGFRTIRAAISLMPRADKYKTLAVTSTIPSEGKSLIAANLAIVFAQTGLKTLLVDADLRRPSVHKAFHLHSPSGLSAYLTEQVANVGEIIQSTEVPNLDVVCCGAIPSSPSELIGSKQMLQFLDQVRNRYDRVVLDCPPVSAVSDPLVLAARSDGVVFVTKFNKIRRHHAQRTIQRIQDAGIYVLGVILNDIDFEGKDSYYYSYYYYQNRYYASHYRTDPDGKPKDGKVKADGKTDKDKTTA